MKKALLITLCMSVLFFTGCDNKNKPINHDDAISCDPSEKMVTNAGGEFTVTVTSTAAWSATANQSWVTISPSSGQGKAYVNISVAAGENGTANVLFSNGESSTTLLINRGGENDPSNPTRPTVDEGMLIGKFSVSASKKVKFSQGNLKAKTTDFGAHWTWSFATNQWDYIGDAVANNAINGNGTVSSNGIVDLFGWSTSSTYYGIHNSTELSGAYSGDFVDWGNNPISNGGNKANAWRTLSKDEWTYLLFSRTNASNLHGQATVNGIHGCILLPDSWTTPSGLSFVASYDWTSNQYSGNNWITMEQAGAVFLPAAGLRNGMDVYNMSFYGTYWASSLHDAYRANETRFSDHSCAVGYAERYIGYSVRLVLDVE